jgi:membrane protein YdbS with pleckstrin-like domain
MTETVAAHPIDPFDSEALNAAEGLDSVDPAYTHVLRVTTLFNMLPIAIGATLLDLFVVREVGGPYGLLSVLAWLLGAIAVVTVPARRAQRWGFKIGEGQLRVARGWLFRTDTIVPFVRVQHIDVGQGPVERWFGLSHLVVHTSGTHNSTVTLPGLHADLAAAMRETIRRHIQTDFA